MGKGSALSVNISGVAGSLVEITATAEYAGEAAGSFVIKTVIKATDPETHAWHREARMRLRSALTQIVPKLGEYKIKIDPGDAQPGAQHDLAAAVAVLRALDRLPEGSEVFFAALALGGQVRGAHGPYVAAKAAIGRALYVAGEQAGEAGLAHGCGSLYATSYLGELIEVQLSAFARDAARVKPAQRPSLRQGEPPKGYNPEDIFTEREAGGVKFGFSHLRGPLTAAARAGEHVLLVGPPGSGKTMIARRLAWLRGPMTPEEADASMSLFSVAGLVGYDGYGSSPTARELYGRRAFRAPHHTVSEAGLCGFGNPPRPGEVSLAHAGVLMLDELPEFRTHLLGRVGEALKSGRVDVYHGGKRVSFPAAPMVVATMNPCPCGYYSVATGYRGPRCCCGDSKVDAYQERVIKVVRESGIRFSKVVPFGMVSRYWLAGFGAEVV